MRRGVLQRMASRLCGLAAFSLGVPLAVALAYGEDTWWAYALPCVLSLVGAFGLSRLPAALAAPRDSIRRREALFIVVMAWLLIVFLTALAYHLTGAFAGFAEAFFESMSGYTTTGATVLRDIEAAPRSVLFQRAFTQWLGGMGIIVLALAILPELAVGGLQLFSAEASSGPSSEKLAPRIAAVARRLWGLYVLLTFVHGALLLFLGLPPFDAIAHAMSTLSTGGFSTRNASIAAFDSVWVELVTIFFMICGAVNFGLVYRVLARRQIRAVARAMEMKLFLGIMAGAALIVTVDNYARGPFETLGAAARHGVFQVVSVMTTTGFGTHDFDTWSEMSRMIIFLLMLVGGCTGSTAGGSKVARLYIVFANTRAQLRRLVRPRIAAPVHINDREIPGTAIDAVVGYYLLYFLVFAVMSVIMTSIGLDVVSGTSAVASAMNSIGPGLGTVGAAEPFADVPAAGLYLLSLGMLLGRLELFTFVVLFTRDFWRHG